MLNFVSSEINPSLDFTVQYKATAYKRLPLVDTN